MYSVNGIPLRNPAFGWRFRAPSKPLSELMKQAQALHIPGRDGITPLPSDFDAPVLPLMVKTPRQNLETLYALFAQPNPVLSLTDAPGRSVAMEYLSTSLQGYGSADAFVDVTFMMRLNGVFWRDTDESTSVAVPLTAASVAVPVFAGMSAPLHDAMVRVQGPVSGLRVTDSHGSWWEYIPSVPTGTNVAFVDGFATLSTFPPDNWDDFSANVSGVADFGGGRGYFEITPTFTDPSDRRGLLTVTTATRGSGANIQVRGRGAYLV